MYLDKLSLKNFRSFKEKALVFSPKTSLILGPNTAGKTNILEAIHLLATGKSFRAETEKEMIKEGEELARIKYQTVSKDDKSEEKTGLEILLTAGQVAGQPTPHKKYFVNGVSRRMIDFVGFTRVVLFWPEDMELVTDSPSRRRRYLDFVLTQIDREYRRSLLSYEKGLRQRNKLLERIRDEGLSRSQLLFWDQLLIRNGSLLTDKRIEFLNFINRSSVLAEIAKGKPFQIEYDKSIISDSRLEQYAQEEVAAAATLVGPHRDDFKFLLGNRDLSLFGSRGEQRMAILWLKLAELEYMTTKTGERPILLLDDIFSELDHEHRHYVLEIIPQQQTIMTTTDLHLIDQKFLKEKEVRIIEL